MVTQTDLVARNVVIIILAFNVWIVKFKKKIPDVFTAAYLVNLIISAYCYANILASDATSNVNTNDGYRAIAAVAAIIGSIVSLGNYYPYYDWYFQNIFVKFNSYFTISTDKAMNYS